MTGIISLLIPEKWENKSQLGAYNKSETLLLSHKYQVGKSVEILLSYRSGSLCKVKPIPLLPPQFDNSGTRVCWTAAGWILIFLLLGYPPATSTQQLSIPQLTAVTTRKLALRETNAWVVNQQLRSSSISPPRQTIDRGELITMGNNSIARGRNDRSKQLWQLNENVKNKAKQFF